MKKGGPLRRHSRLQSGGRIKTKKRSNVEEARVYGPPGFKAFILASPCEGCGVVGFSVRAHVCGNGGRGRKKDWTTIAPLCEVRPRMLPGDGRGQSMYPGCHFLYDNHKLELNGPQMAQRTQERWHAR